MRYALFRRSLKAVFLRIPKMHTAYPRYSIMSNNHWVHHNVRTPRAQSKNSDTTHRRSARGTTEAPRRSTSKINTRNYKKEVWEIVLTKYVESKVGGKVLKGSVGRLCHYGYCYTRWHDVENSMSCLRTLRHVIVELPGKCHWRTTR